MDMSRVSNMGKSLVAHSNDTLLKLVTEINEWIIRKNN